MESHPEKNYGVKPSLNEKALQIISLSWEEFCKKSFKTLNEIFGLEFREDANGESHRILYNELQKVVATDMMLAPLELILKSDGLMIRICGGGHNNLFDEAIELAEKINLPKDRISHSLCKECYDQERERASIAISNIKKATTGEFQMIQLPDDDTSVDRKK